MMMLLDNDLYLAPLGKDIGKALDIGCGTGVWTWYGAFP